MNEAKLDAIIERLDKLIALTEKAQKGRIVNVSQYVSRTANSTVSPQPQPDVITPNVDEWNLASTRRQGA
jgi:hypothetical protein